MRKTQNAVLILFFLMVIFAICHIFCGFESAYARSAASSSKKTFEVTINSKTYKFYSKDFKINRSNLQKKINGCGECQKVIRQMQSMGFSEAEICRYLMPETEEILKRFERQFNQKPQEQCIEVIPNTCKINYFYGKDGVYVDYEDFYKNAISQFKSGKNIIKIDLKLKKFNNQGDIKKQFAEKSSFLTSFASSSEARKNNIREALKMFDGIVLEEGEILSFNKTTGVRDERSGYKQAKIISNGTFVDGFGGGVCQVSTTLYNAALLAGLEVVEVHSHSLPVSYVEPSFDAMVNSGSSDLVLRNNSNGRILITTSYKNDNCRVKIFGIKNKYKITRISEKIKLIPPEPDVIDTDYLKYENLNLEPGENHRISYAKEGFVSNGYLNYYDKKGNLVKTKKIRENTYNPTKGIIVKREN